MTSSSRAQPPSGWNRSRALRQLTLIGRTNNLGFPTHTFSPCFSDSQTFKSFTPFCTFPRIIILNIKKMFSFLTQFHFIGVGFSPDPSAGCFNCPTLEFSKSKPEWENPYSLGGVQVHTWTRCLTDYLVPLNTSSIWEEKKTKNSLNSARKKW